MPDNRNLAAQDRARINMGEDYEVEYWSKKFGVSRERLAEAVRKVGDSLLAIRKEVSRAQNNES